MLTLGSLPLRNARYHAALNLPVLLGVAVGAAVLTGALLVGDSLRGSLRARSLKQLGGVESAYVGPRLLREQLAGELPGEPTPALIVQGAVQAGERRVGRATLIGLNPASPFGLPAPPAGPAVILSAGVAKELGVAAGDEVELGTERFSSVPRSSLLGKKGVDEVTATIRLRVAEVLPAGHPANDFNLSPSPAAPRNVFVPLAYLQAQLDKPGRVNALLSASPDAKGLSAALAEKLTLDDWGLRLTDAPKRGAYLSVESEQLVLDPAAVPAVLAAAKSQNCVAEPTVSYLANAITADDKPLPNSEVGTGRKLIPYSVVAALNVAEAAPLGPFLPPGRASIADDEVVLADWPESPLRGLPVGSPVTLHFFKPELESGTEEEHKTFRLAGYVPLSGPADDANLTPAFPGVTDKLSIGDWQLPFPLTSARIQKRDEAFWARYRATPKAYVNLKVGEALFGSRYGVVTSVRVRPSDTAAPPDAAGLRAKLAPATLERLDASAAGLTFQPLRDRVLAASSRGTEFSALFLAFSGLLILAALMLVGLLFRLAVERRAKEVGVLLATGYSGRQVRSILVREGMAVAAAGTLLGLALAFGYAAAMLWVLGAVWPDREVSRYLTLHAERWTPFVGAALTLAVSYLTLRLSLRNLQRTPAPALLRGVAVPPDVGADAGVASLGRAGLVAGLLALAGAGSLAFGVSASNPDERAGGFFGGGLLILTALLWLGRTWLKHLAQTGPTHTRATVAGLGGRNAGRNLGRSLLTATLIALASFLVVSVESFRRRPDADFLTRSGGSGGFALLAESDVPVFRPLDSGAGRDDLDDRLDKWAQRQEAKNPAGPPRSKLVAEAKADLEGAATIGLRLHGGDDASCLNLYQAGQPRVLGVPDALIERGAFRFGDSGAATPEEKANPWRLLNKPLPGGAVPVILEQNTAVFTFKTALGGTLTLRDGSGAPVTARVVGLLQDSLFQSEALMSEADFRRLYPKDEGYRVFLTDAPPGKADAVRRRLEAAFQVNGLIAVPPAEKVAAYQAVVGAYLTTFQLLGGFALALAVLGLGVVILRNVGERVGELALLRAVGYPRKALERMILAETGVVLGVGVMSGTLAALASVLPNFALGGSVPWLVLAGLAVAVAGAGAGVAALATRGVVRVPVIAALRRE